MFRLAFHPFFQRRKEVRPTFVFVRPNKEQLKVVVKQVVKQHREALRQLRDR